MEVSRENADVVLVKDGLGKEAIFLARVVKDRLVCSNDGAPVTFPLKDPDQAQGLIEEQVMTRLVRGFRVEKGPSHLLSNIVQVEWDLNVSGEDMEKILAKIPKVRGWQQLSSASTSLFVSSGLFLVVTWLLDKDMVQAFQVWPDPGQGERQLSARQARELALANISHYSEQVMEWGRTQGCLPAPAKVQSYDWAF